MDGKLTALFASTLDGPRAVAVTRTPAGEVLLAAGHESGVILVIDAALNARSVGVHKAPVTAVAWCGERVIAADATGSVVSWRRTPQGAKHDGTPLGSHLQAVSVLRASPDGSRVVSIGEDGAFAVWRPTDGVPRVVFDFEVHLDAATAAAFAPDGASLLVGTRRGHVVRFAADR